MSTTPGAGRVNIKIPDPHIVEQRQQLEDDRAVFSSASDLQYDHDSDTIRLSMQSGIEVQIPRNLIDELVGVPEVTLQNHMNLAIGGDAIALRWLDVDISIPGLLRDLLGFNFQRLGGRAKTEAKANAARMNGAKGGRPKSSAKPPLPVVEIGKRAVDNSEHARHEDLVLAGRTYNR